MPWSAKLAEFTICIDIRFWFEVGCRIAAGLSGSHSGWGRCPARWQTWRSGCGCQVLGIFTKNILPRPGTMLMGTSELRDETRASGAVLRPPRAPPPQPSPRPPNSPVAISAQTFAAASRQVAAPAQPCLAVGLVSHSHAPMCHGGCCSPIPWLQLPRKTT